MSRPASADLAEAARRISEDRPAAARRLRRAVAALARHLGQYPFAGTRRPELADDPLRFAVVQGFPYLLAYDSSLRPTRIMRILHGARDLPEVLHDFRSPEEP